MVKIHLASSLTVFPLPLPRVKHQTKQSLCCLVFKIAILNLLNSLFCSSLPWLHRIEMIFESMNTITLLSKIHVLKNLL